jgi:hypothetical protein
VCVYVGVLVICILYSEVFLNLTEVFFTLTEVFPCFFLICKAKCQGKTHKDGAQPTLFHISCYLCCSVYCLCVNVYCHRVTTQLQLTNTSNNNNLSLCMYIYVYICFVLCSYCQMCFLHMDQFMFQNFCVNLGVSATYG